MTLEADGKCSMMHKFAFLVCGEAAGAQLVALSLGIYWKKNRLFRQTELLGPYCCISSILPFTTITSLCPERTGNGSRHQMVKKLLSLCLSRDGMGGLLWILQRQIVLFCPYCLALELLIILTRQGYSWQGVAVFNMEKKYIYKIGLIIRV